MLLLFFPIFTVFSQDLKIKISKPYLNIPVGDQARMKLIKININGKSKREFPVQLAEDSVNYWIYIDVTEFKGKTIELSCPATSKALSRIYQDDKINGSDSLYKESNRPQYHFTVKRGWSNDINGPIFYDNTYHLFWQSFPFGLSWNTGYMYWGHAISKDMLHWTELPPALMLDSLGSPWSGTAVIDKRNHGGWGENALVIYYTAFDLVSGKEVQCIAYSTDGGKTFKRYTGNPVIDSNREMQTTNTRDPKVFWYVPAKVWVMVLFERDGMSFYNSRDMRTWEKESHILGLHECPDFFELPVDGNVANMKWVLHGGSADYFIGTFDGKKFTPETPEMRYAEGKSWNGEDLLYAAQSFENMPDTRRVQIAWGRARHKGMPFTQMMLFPTEFSLITTNEGLKLVANPIKEIENLHATSHQWTSLTVNEANEKLQSIQPGPLHIKLDFKIANGNNLRLRYQGNEILNLAAEELSPGNNMMEILIDKTTAEIFINKGKRYIIQNFNNVTSNDGLVFDSDKYGPGIINHLEVYEMKSIWNNTSE
jgi:sucrose-6-phosphate hydrolase SacC (GH32 family)